MADGKAENDPTLVERWLEDQQQWQRTILTYLDSLTRNDDFLVHLGNAMRGSLLAGKPYPTAAAAGTVPDETPVDDRLDQVLFALHQLQGQLHDLAMTLDELRERVGGGAPVKKPVAKAAKRVRPTRATRPALSVKTRKRRSQR